MIPIRKIAGVLNPSPEGRRYLGIYRFFCDESYDGDPGAPNAVPMTDPSATYIPATYVVAGFLAEEATWTEVKRRWKRENEHAEVMRYHAANVNARDGEFKDWGRTKRDTYAMSLLDIVRDQGMDLHAVACGMLVRDYEEIINANGRQSFGPPHIACFKTLVAVIAQELDSRNFEPSDKFAVVFDHNKHDSEIVTAFLGMKFHPSYKFGGRLATCTPGTWEEYVELQPADLIAYESFKALHTIHTTGDIRARKSLESLFSANGFMGYYLDRDVLNKIKPVLENANCEPNGFILQLGLRNDMGLGIPLP